MRVALEFKHHDDANKFLSKNEYSRAQKSYATSVAVVYLDGITSTFYGTWFLIMHTEDEKYIEVQHEQLKNFSVLNELFESASY